MVTRKMILGVALAMSAMAMIGCGKNTQETAPVARGGFSGHKEETLCLKRDDADFFRATGSANGAYTHKDYIKREAITRAQKEIRERMENSYDGFIDDYSKGIVADKGTKIDEMFKEGGRQIIRGSVNDASVICGPYVSDVDENGHIEVVVGIEISRKDIVDKLSKHVKSLVSPDEVERITREGNKELETYFQSHSGER